MTARSGPPSAKGDRRGTQRHIPVLLPEVLDALAPLGAGTFIDGTFGAGGYTSAILYAAPTARVLAIDRDPTAVAAGQSLVGETGGRLTLVEGTFGELERIATDAGFAPVDGVVLDIGVSSMQLDDPERGFSFQGDGPLDMRMGQDGPTAADIVNREDDSDLADIFFHLGDERRSRAVARAIVARRSEKPFTRTSELAELAERVLGRQKIAGRHAATRIFQALRIYVNDELGQLVQGLAAAERVLKPGGRLAVVTFHSLEDGIVKRFLRRRAEKESQGSRHLPPGESPKFAPSFRITSQRPLTAGDDELAANPRARSAKLRSAIRTQAEAWPEDSADPAIPSL
ncbi:MAG TPA: 16S rRNA (cytosine(1402)-N(4))-methyltransferase RsmH [Hyphomicrobiaceae bacterium]|jgi:16S rRNA (cytosine1402-N4)-methyltransferase|nr:16S rRNA (cytosine(1402)-N(4))-methyltransferase RsmH [Hyphomicrobiaceae bacterium]